jgi:hypothetical protein
MPNLKVLPSIRNSETITCKRCHYAQYPRNGVCLRCGQSLEREYVNLQIDADLEVSKEHLAQLVGSLVRKMRKASRHLPVAAGETGGRFHLSNFSVQGRMRPHAASPSQAPAAHKRVGVNGNHPAIRR